MRLHSKCIMQLFCKSSQIYHVGVNSNEIILIGELNLDWITSSSEALKSICDL